MSHEGKHAVAAAGAAPAFSLDTATKYLQIANAAAKKFVTDFPIPAAVALVAAAVFGFALFLPELAAKIIIFIPLAAFAGLISYAFCCDEDYNFEKSVVNSLRPSRPQAAVEMGDIDRERRLDGAIGHAARARRRERPSQTLHAHSQAAQTFSLAPSHSPLELSIGRESDAEMAARLAREESAEHVHSAAAAQFPGGFNFGIAPQPMLLGATPSAPPHAVAYSAYPSASFAAQDR